MDREGGARYCHECGADLTAGSRFRIIIVYLLVALIVSTAVLGYNLSVWRSYSSELEARNAGLTAEIRELNDRVDELNLKVAELQERSSQLESQLAQTRVELDRYQLKRPTMDELKAFLAEDDTDRRGHDEEGYVCIHYARDLKARAAQRGYNLCFVVVNYNVAWRRGYGHALNGAYLSDGSFVYIEPQSDKIYEDLIDDLKEVEKASRIVIINYSIIW